MSRDVIGQAKGILMERLKLTPEDAFDALRRASQRLNEKLRAVALTLAADGRVRLPRRSPAGLGCVPIPYASRGEGRGLSTRHASG